MTQLEDAVIRLDEKTTRNSIFFIRVIATVFVLFLHANGCFWSFSATEQYWRSANIIECVFYPAVPLFYMVTGITLMDFFDRYSLGEFFKKRFRKTVVPFLAWSIIGLLEKTILHKIDVSRESHSLEREV